MKINLFLTFIFINLFSFTDSDNNKLLFLLDNLIFIGFPDWGPPSCSLVSILIPLIDFVASIISFNIIIDFLLLFQSLYSKLIDPI